MCVKHCEDMKKDSSEQIRSACRICVWEESAIGGEKRKLGWGIKSGRSIGGKVDEMGSEESMDDVLSVVSVKAGILVGRALLAMLCCINPFELAQASAVPGRGQRGGGSNEREEILL